MAVGFSVKIDAGEKRYQPCRLNAAQMVIMISGEYRLSRPSES